MCLDHVYWEIPEILCRQLCLGSFFNGCYKDSYFLDLSITGLTVHTGHCLRYRKPNMFHKTLSCNLYQSIFSDNIQETKLTSWNRTTIQSLGHQKTRQLSVRVLLLVWCDSVWQSWRSVSASETVGQWTQSWHPYSAAEAAASCPHAECCHTDCAALWAQSH